MAEQVFVEFGFLVIPKNGFLGQGREKYEVSNQAWERCLESHILDPRGIILSNH